MLDEDPLEELESEDDELVVVEIEGILIGVLSTIGPAKAGSVKAVLLSGSIPGLKDMLVVTGANVSWFGSCPLYVVSTETP